MALPLTGSRLIAQDADKYIRDMAMAGKVTVRFGDDAGKASVKTIALGAAIGDLAAGAVRQMGQLLQDAGREAVEFMGDSITGARDLEAQMSGVTAVLGGTKDELGQLNDLVIDLGIDPKLKVSSLEAASAIEVLAKNGLDMQTIMDGAARATVFLSNATGGEFAKSADIMTDAADIFNFKGNEMMGVVNGITAVTNNSKFAVDDYALFLANAGKTAANAKVPFSDFNTVMAAIAPSFSSGMTAGTGFANFLLRLIPNTEKAEDVMKELGLVTEDGSNRFFDAQGNMRSMAEVSQILQDAISGLTAQQRQQALQTIFGRDALDAAIAIAEKGEKGFRELGAAMAEVDAENAAATRVDNLAGAMDILDGVIEAVKLRIGNAYLPALTDLARVTTSFLEGNADRFVAFFERGADFVEIFVDHLESGLNPMQAFRATLAETVDAETLALFDDAVDTMKLLVSTAVDLGKWAAANGPEIIRTLEFIGKAFVAFKVITTVTAGVQAFVTTMGTASTVFAAAGGGLSGVVALLGGPVVVAAGLAAAAIGGVAMAWGDFSEEVDKGQDRVRDSLGDLAASAEATGDYEDQARRLTEALELSTTGLGRFTGTAKDVKAAIADLIVQTGDFSGSNDELRESLQDVFGAGIQVEQGMIHLNGTFVAYADEVRATAAAQREAAEASQALAEQNRMLNQVREQEVAMLPNSLDGHVAMTAALHESSLAHQRQVEAMSAAHAFRVMETEATAESIAAMENQMGVQEAAIEMTEEQLAAEKERWEAIVDITQSAAADQASSIHAITLAIGDLDQAQFELAQNPWNEEMQAQAATAKETMAAELEAIKESHRLMVQEIFIQNAQLGGGFNESAANVAVALGLMTEKEAALRLENEQLNTAISRVGDAMTQAFLEDGVVSAKEAGALAEVITGLEKGAFTADEALMALSSGGLAQLIEGGPKVKEGTKAAADGFGEIPDKAGSAIDEALRIFGAPDWVSEGKTVPEDIGAGIDSKNKVPASAASDVADGVLDEWGNADWESVGADVDAGIAAGIRSRSGVVADAAKAVAAAAVAAAKADLGIASPSRVAAEDIGLPVSQGIAVGIVDGTPFVTDAITGLIGKLKATAGEEIGDFGSTLFEFGSNISGFQSGLVSKFEDETLKPLQKRAKLIEESVTREQARIAQGLGADSFKDANLSFADLARLSKSGPDFRTVMAAKRLLFFYREQSRVNNEIEASQRRIAELQKQQADFDFLQQQFEFLSFIKEQGLNPKDILGGVELGLNASLPDLLNVMSDAMSKVIEAAEDELGIASPSRRFAEIGRQIKEGLLLELDDKEGRVQTAVSHLLAPPRSNISLPQTPQQFFSTTTNNQIDRSNSVQIINNGVTDVSSAAQLDFVLAGYT